MYILEITDHEWMTQITSFTCIPGTKRLTANWELLSLTRKWELPKLIHVTNPKTNNTVTYKRDNRHDESADGKVRNTPAVYYFGEYNEEPLVLQLSLLPSWLDQIEDNQQKKDLAASMLNIQI